MKIFAILLIPAVALPSMFLSFGTDSGVALGYDGEWYSVWGGYPFSGFEVSWRWWFIRSGFKISSRLFEENLPGTGDAWLGFEVSDFSADFLMGFTTGESTVVGDSELVGSVSLGFRASYGREVFLAFEYRSIVYGLYRKEKRYYFGFAPHGEYSIFPTEIILGIGYSGEGMDLLASYSFRSGSAIGIPTPIVDIGGLAFRIRVER